MRLDPGEAVRSYFTRLLVHRNPGVCDELLAPDYVDHDAPAGTPPGPEATKEYVRRLLQDVPDLVFDLHELHAAGNAVTIRATWRGTLRDGRPWAQTGLALIHVNDTGQLVERWSAYRTLEGPQL